MIGNAVPVKLAEFVANAVKDYVENKEDTNLNQELDLFELVNA